MARVGRGSSYIPVKIDVSETCKKAIIEKIRPMPGNEGQVTLVSRLIDTLYVNLEMNFLLEITAGPLDASPLEVAGALVGDAQDFVAAIGLETSLIQKSYKAAMKWSSNHPDAIAIIMEAGEHVFKVWEYTVRQYIAELDVKYMIDVESWIGAVTPYDVNQWEIDKINLKNAVTGWDKIDFALVQASQTNLLQFWFADSRKHNSRTIGRR